MMLSKVVSPSFKILSSCLFLHLCKVYSPTLQRAMLEKDLGGFHIIAFIYKIRNDPVTMSRHAEI